MDTFLAYWAEDGDDSLDTFETEQEAVDCLEEWIERRRDDAADEGWPLGMRGYVARLTHRVQEFKTDAPEGSSFESCCDYAVKSLPDAQAARIAALEAENAALRAQLAAPLRLPSVDEVSARVHEAWMESKRRAGVTSRKLEDGEELMVPYADLSEQAKELDRATVRAVYAAIGDAEAHQPAPLRLGRGPTDDTEESIGVRMIAAERQRQIVKEGWTSAHDDEHAAGEMASAAACYAGQVFTPTKDPPPGWPWERRWWKPKGGRIRVLVKAGALIAAEIDRLVRAGEKP